MKGAERLKSSLHKLKELITRELKKSGKPPDTSIRFVFQDDRSLLQKRPTCSNTNPNVSGACWALPIIR